MDPIAALARSFDVAVDVLAAVTPEQWAAQTPCAEWDVRALADHMVQGALMAAAGVRDQPYEAPADVLGDDPAAALRAAGDAVVAGFRARSDALGAMLPMPWGHMPGGMVAGLFTNDELVHAWDAARATGQSSDLDPDLAEGCLAAAREWVTADMRKPGFFGPELPAPDGACAADRLAAFLGRAV